MERGSSCVGEAPAALEHADAVALLGQPQRGDAAAEARADDQPVVVEVLTHCQESLFERLRGIARTAHRAHHRVGVLAAAGLEHELDRGLAHVEVEALAHVGDVDDVAARRGDARRAARRACPAGPARG